MSTLFLVTACSGVNIYSNEHEEQLARVEDAMMQCASSSADYLQLLQRQSEQLQLQGGKLDELVQANVAQEQGMSVYAPGETEVDGANCTVVGAEPSKLTIGRREQVWLEDIQLALPARVDTGAETASLDARNIVLFERNGRRWVRFEILHPDTGEVLSLERKLTRIASISQSNTSEPVRRPVIKLSISIGEIKQSAEFTLSDRSHLDYQMLVGRNILKDVMVVDVSKINTVPLVVGEQ